MMGDESVQPGLGASAVDEGHGDGVGAPSVEFLARIPHEFARRHLVVSTGVRKGVEQLRTAGDPGRLALFNVGVRLQRPISVTLAEPEEIATAIDRAYAAYQAERERASGGACGGASGGASENARASDEDGPPVALEGSQDVEGDLATALRQAESDLLSTQGKAPVVRLVDLLLFEALQRGASDVHLQPLRDRTLVRYRLDGVLHTARELPGPLASAVAARVKVMARLDIAERRAPQDGRASVTIGHASERSGRESSASHSPSRPSGVPRRIDLRIGIMPSTYGERVVVRILDASRSPHSQEFTALGMPNAIEAAFKREVSRANGIVLVTGPTGSGKTTTLYTALSWLSKTTAPRSGAGIAAPLPTPHSPLPSSSPSVPPSLRASVPSSLNLVTIEDPVEYDLSTAGLAISQTQVDLKKGVTFAAGLRHILRQDPDVIMVGEIRDEETARIAVQASLTGHLVLSTLHTNDAPSALARLLDLNVEPFLVASSLLAVLAQRLVRVVHAPCQGQGCALCLGTGFKGRTGVFELLLLDDAMRELIGGKPTPSASVLRHAAIARGMRTLQQAGQDLIQLGITTAAEIERVVGSGPTGGSAHGAAVGPMVSTLGEGCRS